MILQIIDWGGLTPRIVASANSQLAFPLGSPLGSLTCAWGEWLSGGVSRKPSIARRSGVAEESENHHHHLRIWRIIIRDLHHHHQIQSSPGAIRISRPKWFPGSGSIQPQCRRDRDERRATTRSSTMVPKKENLESWQDESQGETALVLLLSSSRIESLSILRIDWLHARWKIQWATRKPRRKRWDGNTSHQNPSLLQQQNGPSHPPMGLRNQSQAKRVLVASFTRILAWWIE